MYVRHFKILPKTTQKRFQKSQFLINIILTDFLKKILINLALSK